MLRGGRAGRARTGRAGSGWKPTLRFAAALIAINLKSSFALRGAFWLQAGFMVANNVLYFTFWWVFFDRFQEIRGWRVADVAALFGVVATGFGAAVVFAGGIRDLSRHIVDGDLDSFLTQPKSPLLHATASRTYASGWGDMCSGVAFLLFSGLVLSEAILAWLGIGIDGSWGQMVDQARDELARDPVVWWNLMAASSALFGLILAVNLVGDAIRDILDPRTLRENL